MPHSTLVAPFRVIGAVCGALFASPSSFAQVMEIGPDGIVITSPAPPVTLLDRGDQKRDRHPAPSPDIAPLLETAGDHANLSARLIEAVSYVESRFNPRALSPKGAVGLMQLMPGTAQDLGVDANIPSENASGGAQYLRRMLSLFDNNVELALAAYNAGPEAVIRHGGIPPFRETQEYVSQVMSYLAEISLPESSP
jgi:soluble lytic murein transglycosylase-like protein